MSEGIKPSDQEWKSVLHYMRRAKRCPDAGVLSVIIGTAAFLLSLACVVPVYSYGPLESFIGRLAFDHHLGLLLLPLSLTGLVIAIQGWRKTRSDRAVMGITLSGLAVLAALLICGMVCLTSLW